MSSMLSALPAKATFANAKAKADASEPLNSIFLIIRDFVTCFTRPVLLRRGLSLAHRSTRNEQSKPLLSSLRPVPSDPFGQRRDFLDQKRTDVARAITLVNYQDPRSPWRYENEIRVRHT